MLLFPLLPGMWPKNSDCSRVLATAKLLSLTVNILRGGTVWVLLLWLQERKSWPRSLWYRLQHSQISSYLFRALALAIGMVARVGTSCNVLATSWAALVASGMQSSSSSDVVACGDEHGVERRARLVDGVAGGGKKLMATLECG